MFATNCAKQKESLTWHSYLSQKISYFPVSGFVHKRGQVRAAVEKRLARFLGTGQMKGACDVDSLRVEPCGVCLSSWVWCRGQKDGLKPCLNFGEVSLAMQN